MVVAAAQDPRFAGEDLDEDVGKGVDGAGRQVRVGAVRTAELTYVADRTGLGLWRGGLFGGKVAGRLAVFVGEFGSLVGRVVGQVLVVKRENLGWAEAVGGGRPPVGRLVVEGDVVGIGGVGDALFDGVEERQRDPLGLDCGGQGLDVEQAVAVDLQSPTVGVGVAGDEDGP